MEKQRGQFKMPFPYHKAAVQGERVNFDLNRSRFKAFLAIESNRMPTENDPATAAIAAGMVVPFLPEGWKVTFEQAFRVARENGASQHGAMMFGIIAISEEYL